MKIQSLSVVVPTNGCINNCPFCVSKMHETDKWVDENNVSESFFDKLDKYIIDNGKLLGKLPFGSLQYEIGGENGISVVVDSDCMNDEVKEEFKYLILRENCKLYSKWNSKSSLIF